MSIILDLIIVGIVVLTVFSSARHGFVRTVIELAGFVAVIFLTFTISTPLAGSTYDKIIEPSVVKSVSQSAMNTTGDVVNKTWESLPSIIKNNSEKLGISKEKINQKISVGAETNAQITAKTVSQNYIKPIVVKLISLLYSSILLVILMFIVRIIAKYLNKLFSFSLAGKLNRTLGGILGIPKGLLLAIAFCCIITIIVSITKNGFLIFNNETIDNSHIFRFLIDLTPFK